MLRRFLLLAACLTAPVLAAPSEPSPAQIRHSAEACTAQDAFGVRYNERFSGTRQAGPEWAPFQELRLSKNTALQVEATASFAKALMSNEDRVSLAAWVFHALDNAIQSEHNFAQRAAHPNGVTYHSAAGLTLDLSHVGVVVHIVCAKS